MMQPSLNVRPQLFTMLLTATFIFLLTRHRLGDQRALWWLPPLMILWVNLHGGYLIGLVFFAMSNVVLGYLVIKSGYLPKLLGYLLMVVVPVGYLIDSFATFLWPGYPAEISQMIIIPVGLSEVAVALWLLVKGVSVDRQDVRQFPAARAAEAPAD